MSQKNYILRIVFILSINFGWCQNTFKQYFFGSENFYKDNSELIIIVKNPQTEFAENLGSRYYNDTVFIKRISSEFYSEIDTSIHEQSSNFCGCDLYFYTKKNQNLFLIKAINSSCDIEEVGIIDSKNQCKNLELLATSGSLLEIDTLLSMVYPETKDSILKDVIFHRNVGIVEGNVTSESYYYSRNNNSSNLPKWYYDYFIEVSPKLDSTISINQNIITYIEKRGIDSVQYKDITWQIDPLIAEEIEFSKSFGCSLPKVFKIKFFIKKDFARYFQDEIQNCLLPQNLTDFENDSNKRILLFKIKKGSTY
jgi:hypothetical protein